MKTARDDEDDDNDGDGDNDDDDDGGKTYRFISDTA